MEDDDEFGDLYTDVLRPFASSSSSVPQPQQSSLRSPIDLNLQTVDDEILYGVPYSNSDVPRQSINHTVASSYSEPIQDPTSAGPANSGLNLIERDERDERLVDRKENSTEEVKGFDGGDVELHTRALEDVKHGSESAIGVNRKEVGIEDSDLMDKDVKFDIEEDGTGIEDMDLERIIPGLSNGGGDGGLSIHGLSTNLEDSRRDNESGDRGEGDDWDSDSEDDLQIVLNDNNHGHMIMEKGGMVGDDGDEDEDGDPLVIVGDGDQAQAAEEQEWGEDTAQAADGERKEMGETGKPSGGMAAAPKIGYSNHVYHPFHSQFKYVRPGAVPMPGATTTSPGGPSGQVRPLVNMGHMAGRGRGDWRPTGIKNTPPMQKGFHSGPWPNSTGGRGFGGGLEFTLPSHKSIFDVDIDSFEEKPWKFPGVDTTDFFNFGFNEESWKDYCTQLEQLRLESTMQSKIRVYESGRTEQDYDPDLPPELAAATGIHDVPAENSNPGKSDVGESDLTKGSTCVRPPLPTGRAIQVEGGYGERLPSIDTRPPRMRDSDAIIEIVLQDSADDDSATGAGVQDQPTSGPPREDSREGHVVEQDIAQVESECFGNFPLPYKGRKREVVAKRMPFMNPVPNNIPEGDGPLSFPEEETIHYPGSRVQTPVYSGGNFDSTYEERKKQESTRDLSPRVTPSGDIKKVNSQNEDSVESVEGKQGAPLSSPATISDARESSMEPNDAEFDETVIADGSSGMEKADRNLNIVNKKDVKDGEVKRQKLTSCVEQPLLQELDGGKDSRAAISSDNSKARSGSSRDYHKHRDGFDEEVVQDARTARLSTIRRHPDENDHGFRRQDHDGREERERSRMVMKGRDISYPYRDLDPSSGHQLYTKADGFDRQRDKDNPDVGWLRKDDDSSRRIRTDEIRKRERGDEIGSSHRGKVRENERSDKDDIVPSRKHLDNGTYRVHYDRDVGSRNRERDDGLKSRYETVDDYHSKRRKEEEYLRRDHIEKEETFYGYRESTTRRRRERGEVLDQRKRGNQQRIRDNLDDHYAARHKDEGWSQREMGDRPRDREEWHRLKQSHEENPSKRERDEGRGALRSGRGAEEKLWVGRARTKDGHKISDKEYQYKDTMRHSETKKDRIEDGSLHHKVRDDPHVRGNQVSGEERRSRQEKSITRSVRDERNHKDNTRKNKETDVSDHNGLALLKRHQENEGGHMNDMGSKGSIDQVRGEHEIPGHRLSRKHREDVSSDDEQQDSRRGRSKLERWTSHKDMDYSIDSKLSSSLKFKEMDKDNNVGSSEAGKALDQSAQTVEAVDNQQLMSVEGEDAFDIESNDADTKQSGDRYIDTVEKLKKRSERFKLPMPSEKEAVTINKMESEALPTAKTENPAETVVKQERPPRKRRWISK
ncbi:FIP1 [Quillaja saponaria]|uniref:FIP1 n=1 Tax=Quillaja saponaria TaxID=32244 RepID=A0AAD7LW40_QUISA|nr:FIP1 [Quillaja saponaria]